MFSHLRNFLYIVFFLFKYTFRTTPIIYFWYMTQYLFNSVTTGQLYILYIIPKIFLVYENEYAPHKRVPLSPFLRSI